MPNSTTTIPPLHFFTATLGDAQLFNAQHPHGIRNVNELLDQRAAKTPDKPAVGIPLLDVPKADWGYTVLTYKELLLAVNSYAHALHDILPTLPSSSGKSGPVIAILSESSISLLLSFLGLLRLGCTVLLLAPQLDTPALNHLIYETSAHHLLCSPRLASQNPTLSLNCPYSLLPVSPPTIDKPVLSPPNINPEQIAYIHHTSGTTSGRPSAIPQPHAAASKWLLHLPPPSPTATLTTTPLYHGGVADFFRSAMSESMIWIWPPTVAITAGNVIRLSETADKAARERNQVDVKVGLFTAVPYVQKLLAETEEGMKWLSGMEMVGVGGAAMPEEVGDDMVQNGVRLVSRFGSSECGFLMSSYRNFAIDKAWNYLRLPPNSPSLVMEPRDDKFELIVKPGWPHIAKTNRPDGSYATSDLFAPHRTLPNAYKYLTRADSTIVLTSGRKFDPTPLETALRRLPDILEAIVFGSNREQPGVLIFTSPQTKNRGELISQVAEVLEWVNTDELPAYGRVEPGMVVMIEDGRAWPKTSKGTAIRKLAEEWFETEIQRCYERQGERHEDGTKVKAKEGAEEEVRAVVREVVEDVTGRRLQDGDDLFMAGVDSMQAMGIRKGVLGRVEASGQVPGNVVFECMTIDGFVKFLCGPDKGKDVKDASVDKATLDEMRAMVSQFASVPAPNKPLPPASVVILTGATGALGAHILHYLITLGIPQIYCLIRATTHSAAETRLRTSLLTRGLPPYLTTSTTTITPLSAELSDPVFSLPADIFATLERTATTIIHAAWPVNFLAPLGSFVSALEGVKNLLNLANHPNYPKRFIFCSSVASVIANPSTPIPEEWSDNSTDSSPLGYARSKWVAESIVRAGGGEVVRIGQLSGDREKGVWNKDEGWPMMIRSIKEVGCLPRLEEEVHWLPVDIAAGAIGKIAVRKDGDGKRVWTVVNHLPVEWDKVVKIVKEVVGGEVVEPREWVRRLEEWEGREEGRKVRLLDMWKQAYGGEKKGQKKQDPQFEIKAVDSVWEGFSHGFELDDCYIGKLISAMQLNADGKVVEEKMKSLSTED